MKRLRVHVQHVPGVDRERDACVLLLREQFDACVHEDRNRAGVMPTWLGVLECAQQNDQDLAWTILLQDDVVAIPGWTRELPSALWNCPTQVLSLSHCGQYGAKILDRGAPYGVGTNLIWGLAVAYRRAFFDGMASWMPGAIAATGFAHDDRAIGAYALRLGARTGMCARAIFDHVPGRSLLGHGGAIRRPVATIANTFGPSWAAQPRSVPLSLTVDQKTRELAAYVG